jgi:hypothetical protein
MTRQSAGLSMAGVLLCWSAAFRVFSVLVAGIHVSTFVLLVCGIAAFGIARSFLRGAIHWTRPAIPLVIAGTGFVYLLVWMNADVPSWWLVPIIWLDLATAALLVWHLLRR